MVSRCCLVVLESSILWASSHYFAQYSFYICEGKRSKNEEESPILKVEDVSDEDVIINNKPKRRRIIVESDDFDIENDKDVTNIGKGKEDFDYHSINEDDDSDEDKQPKVCSF